MSATGCNGGPRVEPTREFSQCSIRPSRWRCAAAGVFCRLRIHWNDFQGAQAGIRTEMRQRL